MKHIVLPIIVSATILVSTGSALANCSTCVERPYYLGIDAEWRDMGFKPGLGDNLFKSKYLEGNVYGGMKFTDYFGIEIGYRESAKKHSTTANAAGSVQLGDIITEEDGAIYSNNFVQIKSPYFNLVGYLPIFQNCRTQLFGSLGFAHMWVKLRHRITGVVPQTFTEEEQNAAQVDFRREKFILQAQIGVQQMLNACFGLRAVVGWQNTSKLNKLKSIRTSNLSASLKNSTTYGLGIFWNF